MILSNSKFAAVARNEKITSLPDLQQLVKLRGGYQNITAEDWTKWDLQNAEWERSRKEELERLAKYFAAARLEKNLTAVMATAQPNKRLP